MPAIQYWFAGSAIAALIAFAAAVLGTGYGWYRAAVSEQDSAAQNADTAAQSKKYFALRTYWGKRYSMVERYKPEAQMAL